VVCLVMGSDWLVACVSGGCVAVVVTYLVVGGSWFMLCRQIAVIGHMVGSGLFVLRG